MSIIHPHRTFPSDLVPIEVNMWWAQNADLFLRCLTQVKYHRSTFYSEASGNLLIYPPKCNIKENEMNGRKPSRHGSGTSNSNGKPSSFQWINIPLTSEDLDTLEREEASIELLAYDFIQLGVRGFGLSVKYDNARKSYSVSIYGSDSTNNNKPCGISGSSAELRDALLVSLYRFNIGLQGSFDDSTTSNTILQSGRFK